MGFYKYDDITDLEQWAVDARAAREDPNLRVEEPESENLKTFLRVMLGTQWELNLLLESGEVLFCQLRAHMAGYNLLTSFKRRQWLRLFPDWTVTEKREQLALLANSGGFLEL